MIDGDTMQAAAYQQYYFGGELRGQDTTESAIQPPLGANCCGPEWTETAMPYRFDDPKKPFDGNRHQRRKAAAIDRAWEKRRKKEAKP